MSKFSSAFGQSTFGGGLVGLFGYASARMVTSIGQFSNNFKDSDLTIMSAGAFVFAVGGAILSIVASQDSKAGSILGTPVGIVLGGALGLAADVGLEALENYDHNSSLLSDKIQNVLIVEEPDYPALNHAAFG